MFILYVDTTSMYSYQKLTGHKLCQFLQYEGYYNSFLREMRYFFFSTFIKSKIHFYMIFFIFIFHFQKQKTVLILLSLILEILKFLFSFA